MQSRWRKLTTFALILVMLSSVFLAACGNRNNEQAGSAAGVTESTQNAGSSAGSGGSDSEDPFAEWRPKEGKTYEISWLPYIVEPVGDDAVLKKYYEEMFNVKFDLLNLDNQNITELLNLKFAGGDIPDYIANGIDINNLPQYVKQGVLMEITPELIEALAPDLYEKATAVNPNWLDYAKVDGKIYGLPEMRNDIGRYATVWRGDWLENVGITKVPDTLEEFEEAFYKFAHEDPDGNGKHDTYGLSFSGLAVIFGAYGYLPGFSPHAWQDWFWHERDGELVFGAVQPEMKEALALIHKWYKDGVLDPEFITGENMGGYWALSHAFVNGRIGFSSHGNFYHWIEPQADGSVGTNYAELAKIDQEAADKLVHSQPPLGPGGRNQYTDNMVPGKIIAFGRNLEKEKDKFGKIMEIINHTSGTTLENNLTATLGFKGEMWEEDPEIPGVYRAIGKWAELGDRVDGKMIFQQSFAVFPPSGLRMQWAEEKGYGIMTQNKLQAALPSETKYRAELTKLRDETYISIITGDKPIDYFDEFVEKWFAMGGEQLYKEANEWYANFK